MICVGDCMMVNVGIMVMMNVEPPLAYKLFVCWTCNHSCCLLACLLVPSERVGGIVCGVSEHDGVSRVH